MVNKVPKERIGLAEIIQILQSRMKKNIIKNATNFASIKSLTYDRLWYRKSRMFTYCQNWKRMRFIILFFRLEIVAKVVNKKKWYSSPTKSTKRGKPNKCITLTLMEDNIGRIVAKAFGIIAFKFYNSLLQVIKNKLLIIYN